MCDTVTVYSVTSEAVSARACCRSTRYSDHKGGHVSKRAHCGRCPWIQTCLLTCVTLPNQFWDRVQVTFGKEKLEG